MKKIVITGASGFVGGMLSKHFSLPGYSIVPVSRKYVSGGIQVKDYFECPKGDVLIHLAEEPDRLKVNNMGVVYKDYSLELMSFLVNRFSGSIVYASSSTVYGQGNSSPIRESANVVSNDLYSEIKIDNESQTLKSGGVVARFSNIYGAGMSGNNVLSDIVGQISGDSPILLRNTSPVRDFIYIADIVSALQKIVNKSNSEVFNIGSGVPCSIFNLAKTVLAVAGGSPNRVVKSIEECPNKSINVLDISRMYDKYKWKPSYSLSKGISETIKGQEFK